MEIKKILTLTTVVILPLGLFGQSHQLEVNGPDLPDLTVAKIRTTYQGSSSSIALEARATAGSLGTGGVFLGSFQGLAAFSSSGHGIDATSDQNLGLYAASNTYSAGLFLCKNKLWPDLILGAVDGTSLGDDCRLGSDPNFSGSDLFLTSNDAIVLELDRNNDEEGQFEIRNSTMDAIYYLSENGLATQTGTQAVIELKSTNSGNGSVLTQQFNSCFI